MGLRSPAAALALLLLASVAFPQAQRRLEPPRKAWPTCVALVTDPATFEAAAEPIAAWRELVEAEGLGVYLAAGEWASPDELRAFLEGLAKEGRLEGALLAGELPVALVRGAHHLTSAFKMDEQRFPRSRSSVPSDAFYEDFALRFDALGRDEAEPRLWYYQLAADSPQVLRRAIYVARLLPSGADRPQQVRDFLARCVEQRRQGIGTLTQALVVGGHGYHSESLEAWQGLLTGLREELPALARPGGSLTALYHAGRRDLERRVLRELQDGELDLAIFHAHGTADRQLLLGDPEPQTLQARIEELKRQLRGRLRRALAQGEALEEAAARLATEQGVPVSWLDGALDDETQRADEAEEGLRELLADEVAQVPVQAELVVLDGCFNGAFTADPHVASRYLFGRGRTLAVAANSVNVLQDVWPTEFLGLLAHEVSIGQWHRRRPQLEAQLLGDPTWHFALPGAPGARGGGRAGAGRDPFDAELLEDAPLRAMLSPESPPALREWAVALSARRQGTAFEQGLVRLLGSDPAQIVRLQALAQLAALRGAAFERALPLASRDPSEFVRRKAVDLMGDVGRMEHLPALLRALLRDPSQRVVFRARTAIQLYEPADVEIAVDEYLLEEGEAAVRAQEQELLAQLVESCRRALADDLSVLDDPQAEAAKKLQAISVFRNQRAPRALPGLLRLALAPGEDERVRTTAIETLGWFQYAPSRALIIEGLQTLAGDAAAPAAVRSEARKTCRRLADGPNHPLTP